MREYINFDGKNPGMFNEELFIPMVDLVFSFFVYKHILNLRFRWVLLFILFYTLMRSVEINSMKNINNKFASLSMLYNLFAMWLWCMTVVISIHLTNIEANNIINLSKSKLLLISILYAILYYYNNWRVIKKYNSKPCEYSATMYQVHSLILGVFYIVTPILMDDRLQEIMFLGPVIVGITIIVYNEIKVFEDTSNQ